MWRALPAEHPNVKLTPLEKLRLTSWLQRDRPGHYSSPTRLQVEPTRCHHVSGARPTAGLGVARVITSDPCGKVPPPLPPQSGTVRAAVDFVLLITAFWLITLLKRNVMSSKLILLLFCDDEEQAAKTQVEINKSMSFKTVKVDRYIRNLC